MHSARSDYVPDVLGVPAAMPMQPGVVRLGVRDVYAEAADYVKPTSSDGFSAYVQRFNIPNHQVNRPRVRFDGDKGEVDVWVRNAVLYAQPELGNWKWNVVLNRMATEQLEEIQMNMQHRPHSPSAEDSAQRQRRAFCERRMERADIF